MTGNVASKVYRKKNRDRGLCVICGKKPEIEGNRHCNYHILKTQEINKKCQRKKSAEARRTGKCKVCKELVTGRGLLCHRCRVVRNAGQRHSYRKRRARELQQQNLKEELEVGMPENPVENVPTKFITPLPEESYVEGEVEVEFIPCDSIPGSEDKVDTLSFRYDNGLPFWHPEDSTYEIKLDVIL